MHFQLIHKSQKMDQCFEHKLLFNRPQWPTWSIEVIEKASKNTIELDVIGMVIIMVHQVQYTGDELRGLDLKQSAYFKISGFHFGWPRPEEVPCRHTWYTLNALLVQPVPLLKTSEVSLEMGKSDSHCRHLLRFCQSLQLTAMQTCVLSQKSKAGFICIGSSMDHRWEVLVC